MFSDIDETVLLMVKGPCRRGILFSVHQPVARMDQLVIPLLIKLRANSQYKPAITNAIIAEIRAPFRKLMTKVPLLVAITKPMIGHKQSEHMK